MVRNTSVIRQFNAKNAKYGSVQCGNNLVINTVFHQPEHRHMESIFSSCKILMPKSEIAAFTAS